MDAELRELCERLRNAFDYMDAVDSDYARQVAREIADGILDTLAAQAAELEGVRKDAERLQVILDKVPVSELEDWIGYGIGDWERVPTLDEFRKAIDTTIADSGAGGG